MAQNKKTETKEIVKPVARSSAPKPPKKLIPRTAPKPAMPEPEVVSEPVAAPLVATPVVGLAVAAAKPAVKRVKKVDVELEATNARNKKAMSEALAKAMAVKIAQPLGLPLPAPELPKSKKPVKAAKPKKIKLVRDSYAMPDNEYAALGALKKRLGALGKEFKKSEFLRAGIATLVALNDVELAAVMGRVERIKTGRPAK